MKSLYVVNLCDTVTLFHFRLQETNSYGWHLDTRRLLRFTARIVNKGNADFRPAIPKHLWQFHACHM